MSYFSWDWGRSYRLDTGEWGEREKLVKFFLGLVTAILPFLKVFSEINIYSSIQQLDTAFLGYEIYKLYSHDLKSDI